MCHLCHWLTTVGFISAIHTVSLSITEEGFRNAAGFIVTWVSALLWELHAVDFIWSVLTLRCAVTYKLHVYTLPAMSALELAWRIELLKYVNLVSLILFYIRNKIHSSTKCTFFTFTLTVPLVRSVFAIFLSITHMAVQDTLFPIATRFGPQGTFQR